MTLDDLLRISLEPNVAAFLRVIREAESSQGDDAYRMLFGGERVDDLSRHPGRVVERVVRGSDGETKVLRSSAAGAYQFLSRTWREIAGAYAITDFEPASQDAAAVALLHRASALDDVRAGRFEAAIRRCASTWAGLPGDVYGQGGISMARARETYARWGGALADVVPIVAAAPPESAPIVESIGVEIRPHEPAAPPADAETTTTPREAPNGPRAKPETIMSPILAAVLPVITQAIPALAKIFGAGSAVAERNARAAEVVAQVVQEATGAVNVQQAAERIAADPVARQAAADAVQARWFDIVEAGGGGLQAARAQNLELAKARIPIWEMPALIVSILLLIPLYLLVGSVLWNPDAWPEQMQVQVATALLSVIGLIGAFWLGSSISSQRKDRAP